MKRWKDWPALRSPNGMRRNSQSPNGVITAVLWMSPSWTGIW
jgi:hypothetical protein